MKTLLLATLALSALAGSALADDVADLTLDVTVAGVDPAVDGDHSVRVRVFTDAAGTPGAEILVDGAPVLP